MTNVKSFTLLLVAVLSPLTCLARDAPVPAPDNVAPSDVPASITTFAEPAPDAEAVPAASPAEGSLQGPADGSSPAAANTSPAEATEETESGAATEPKAESDPPSEAKAESDAAPATTGESAAITAASDPTSANTGQSVKAVISKPSNYTIEYKDLSEDGTCPTTYQKVCVKESLDEPKEPPKNQPTTVAPAKPSLFEIITHIWAIVEAAVKGDGEKPGQGSNGNGGETGQGSSGDNNRGQSQATNANKDSKPATESSSKEAQTTDEMIDPEKNPCPANYMPACVVKSSKLLAHYKIPKSACVFCDGK